MTGNAICRSVSKDQSARRKLEIYRKERGSAGLGGLPQQAKAAGTRAILFAVDKSPAVGQIRSHLAAVSRNGNEIQDEHGSRELGGDGDARLAMRFKSPPDLQRKGSYKLSRGRVEDDGAKSG